MDFTFLLFFSHQTYFFFHSTAVEIRQESRKRARGNDTQFFFPHYFSINPQNSSFYFHLKEVLFWCKLLNLTWTTSFDMMLALGHTVFIFCFTTPHVQTCRCPFLHQQRAGKTWYRQERGHTLQLVTLVLGKIPRVGVTHCEKRVSGKEQKGGSTGAGHSFLDSRTPSLFLFLLFWHHGVQWEIWAWESRELWGFSGSSWYEDTFFFKPQMN